MKTTHIIKDKKYASDEEIDAINKEVKDMVKECEKFAEDSPFPDLNILPCLNILFIKKNPYTNLHDVQEYISSLLSSLSQILKSANFPACFEHGSPIVL